MPVRMNSIMSPASVIVRVRVKVKVKVKAALMIQVAVGTIAIQLRLLRYHCCTQSRLAGQIYQQHPVPVPADDRHASM